MNPVKKRFESGASKRKHKAEEDRKTKLLPSVSKFFKKVSVEISYSNPNVNENLQETHPCLSLSSPVKIEHISQNVTSNANLSSTLVNTISQEIPNTSISSLANNVPNIDIFTKLLTLPNPTDIGHFNYDNKLSDSQKKFIVTLGPCQPKGPFYRHSDVSKNKNSRTTFHEKYYYSVESITGAKTNRLWLCYSIIRQVAYCQPCSLFGNRIKIKQTTWLDSYDDWDHITIAINRHESSTFHRVM
ncbi:Hypothetical protein CINCED_3A023245 [Cinara cedri]|uniref:Uncharacterized protein n=1 Tax=Cinara cedri TaxID=506608 RepID=A0A5E4NHR6_9HEMI|nr:Hypothetical protein CINCED_3A023245 [Cinara cedri]